MLRQLKNNMRRKKSISSLVKLAGRTACTKDILYLWPPLISNFLGRLVVSFPTLLLVTLTA